ncbi:RNA polymerase II-associated protein 3 [Rana temporaria]|uniref:RNA polymerase II-associated protein 3 n=1 Tax=Rana temporaria TaxID=8407 RepID=UPI001AAD601F|nr:RNA polymerase II-associated protein 3 [Rana temporaria]XP_040199850.1 RNA polymerase II-associated protein 3 [Rana temporaria]
MSSPNKAIELQLQMRQNAEELQDFMKELDSWEKDIKEKDVSLRIETGESEATLPPIRNKDYRKKKKSKSTDSNENKQGNCKKPKRKLLDYEYWDKMDVDKALQEIDKEDNTNESVSTESDSGDDDGILIDKNRALTEKEKGNDYFRAGKYDEAVQCYTKGMNADPYNAVLPTNRASTFFRLKKYAVAESDCNLAIALDRNYSKAYARRGAARLALKNLQGAKEDYEKVLELDSNNFEATNELRKINCELQASGITQEQKEEVKENEIVLSEEDKKAIEAQKLKQQAIVQKDLGNAYFKEGKYEAAIECYTQGITADSTNALLPANRAMAYLKIQKYMEAEEDCTQALALDTTYGKAYARRGTARVMLRKLKEAKEDFETVLKLEPGNKQAASELAKISQELGDKTVMLSQNDLANQSKGKDERKYVKPIEKPAHLRSTKPLRRMEIEELGAIAINPVNVLTENTPCNVKIVSQVEEPQKENLNVQEEISISPDIPSAKIIKIEEIGDAPTLQSNTDNHVPPQTLLPKVINDVPPLLPPMTTDVPGVPTSSFQLESDFRSLKGNQEMLYKYIKQIEPSMYTKIFQKALDPDVFNEMIKILRLKYIANEDAAKILEILQRLSELRRFDMAVMFLSESEKEDVRALFNFVKQSLKTSDSFDALKKKYGI